MKRSLALILVVLALGGLTRAAVGPSRFPPFDPKLPPLGAQLSLLPDGPGKETADKSCLTCHSSDILRQQRLTEAQWTASVKKMVGWGAEVPDDKREELVKYLASHFGPDNDRFRPVETRPVGH